MQSVVPSVFQQLVGLAVIKITQIKPLLRSQSDYMDLYDVMGGGGGGYGRNYKQTGMFLCFLVFLCFHTRKHHQNTCCLAFSRFSA